MSGWWQQLPGYIDPIFFSIGFFSIRWYGLCFLAGILMTWWYLTSLRQRLSWGISRSQIESLFFFALCGSFFGARFGYVFWYAPEYFLLHPVSIFWPFDIVTGDFIGIAGLSFHGAVFGMMAMVWVWTRAQRVSFFLWLDRLILVLPIGIFFGRLGNFLNGELWGRVTQSAWGMYFPRAGDMFLRHPSPLYEMIGEGGLFFLVLWWRSRRSTYWSGVLTGYFFVGYGMIRFVLEYWREPDAQIGLLMGVFSLGQLLSVVFFGIGCGLLAWHAWFQGLRKSVLY